MPRTMMRIPKLHGPVVPEAGWEMAGTTLTGQQLYTEKIPRSRAVPDFEQIECTKCFGEPREEECQECMGTGTVDGKRIWITNPLTNAPLYKKNKAEFYTQERMFFIESDGQGNQYKVDWAPPTPEQIEAIRHEKAVANMVPALASALVDRGLSVDEIVSRLTAEPAAPERTPEAPIPFDGPKAPEPATAAPTPTAAPEEAADIVPAVDPDASEEL